jgi:hypothetical protein
MFLYGEEVEHLIARIGQRLSDKGATKEGEKFQLKCKNESEADARSGCKVERRIVKRGANSCERAPRPLTFAQLGANRWTDRNPCLAN